MAAPPRRAGNGVIKTQIKDLQDRVDRFEGRLDRVEYRQEQDDAYRRVRLEHCGGMDELWTNFENKVFPAKELKGKVCELLKQELQRVGHKEYNEAEVQAKAQELSHQKRGIAGPEDRKRLLAEWNLDNTLEWVRKDRSGAYNLILQRGEPSRLLHERLRREVNWVLFVLARMSSPPAGLQLYPDRGPITRARKGGGKGGPGKGGKGGRGRGRGRDRGDAA